MFVDVVAWAVIVIGMLSAAGHLATLTIGRPRHSPGNLLLSVFIIVLGACILTAQSKDVALERFAAAAIAVITVLILAGPKASRTLSSLRRRHG